MYWDFKAAVVVSGLVMDWILDNVVWGGLEDGYFGWYSGGLDIFQGGLLEPAPDHLVEEGQPQVFTSFLKSREVVLRQKTCNRPRSFGLVVPGDEADCVSLDALHLADILLPVRVPDDGTVL